MVNEFINELANDWWVTCKHHNIDLNPNDARCIDILERILHDNYQFSWEDIQYVTEVMTSPKKASPTHYNFKGDLDSGIDVDDDETSVSAHLDDELDESGSLNEDEWVKNKKSGNVYQTKTFNSERHTKPTDDEIKKSQDSGDSKPKDGDEDPDDTTPVEEPNPQQAQDAEARAKADVDIKQNALTAAEQDKKKGDSKSDTTNDNIGGLLGTPGSGDFDVKSDMLKYGFSEYTKATGKKPAPGSAGSAFNEIMSGNGVNILKQNPNLTESELANQMYNATIKTKLGQEQTRTTGIGTIPSDIENKKLYSKCIIAARSARTKYDMTMNRVENLNKNTEFGQIKDIHTFYGADTSISAQIELVNDSNKILLPDGREVSKVDVIKFIKQSGGGNNPSDTATFVTDIDNNLLIQFHSDKTSTKDIQDNSTLIQEGTNYKQSIDANDLSELDKTKANSIIDKYTNEIIKIEDSYVNQTTPIASNLKNVDLDTQVDIIEGDTGTLKKNINAAIFGKSGIKNQYKDYVPKGKSFDNLSLKDQYQMILDLVADGKGSPADVKVINKIALQLQNDRPDIKGIDIKSILSEQRERVVNLQRDRISELDKMKINVDGAEVGVGTLMEANEAIRGFHLELMDYPPKGYTENDPKSLMGSSLDINMGGTSVTGETLRKCMGVANTTEFKKRFKLKTQESYIKDSDGNITGKDVFVYTIDSAGNQIDIGKKSYRSKQGATGKTNNTMVYSKKMQSCFKKQ